MAKIDEKIPEHHLPYGPGPRAAERIFETARDLFYREGIRAVGVDEIVTKAGVTKPSLYRSFKSKDELVAAVLREVEVGFWDRFAAAEAAFPGDPKAQMVAYFEGLAARSGGADYRGCALSNAVVEYPDRDMPAGPWPRPTSRTCARVCGPRPPRWARPTPANWATR
jgi:AcrR family transcriptional regulator